MNGVLFNDTHSYYDLALILAPFTPAPAEPKTNYVDVPGADGSLDQSEGLGEIKYHNRTLNFVFSVPHSVNYEEKITEVSNLINGKYFEKITLDKDPEWYYSGRCKVDSYKSDRVSREIAISATVFPYKFKQDETVVTLTGSEEYSVENSRQTVVPIIVTDSPIELSFNGINYQLNAGTHKILDVQLKEGANVFKITPSSAVVTLTYQEGAL